MINKFGTEVSDTCSHVTGGSRILNDFLAQTRGLRSQTNVFFTFLTLLGPKKFQSPPILTDA